MVLKLKRKGEILREMPVTGIICGVRIDSVEFDVIDVTSLYKLSDVQRNQIIENLFTRFVPKGFDDEN